MKKSIIALAVAGAMTAPIIAQADATLYGRVHQRIVLEEDKDVNVANAEARLGVKGSSETDSGLTAFYQIELALRGDNVKGRAYSSSRQNNNQEVRQMNAGLKGDFGKVTIGRFTNPMTATYAGDIFEGESGPYQLATYRIGKAVSYQTPTFSGISASATIIGDGGNSDTTDRDVDSYVLAVKGSFGPISAAFAYQDIDALEAANDSTEKEIASGSVAYSANGLYVGLGYETDDVADVDVIDFGAKYTVGKTGFGLGYAKRDGVGSVESDRIVLGVYHDLGGSADVYSEFAQHDATDAAGVDSDFNRVSVGYRVKF